MSRVVARFPEDRRIVLVEVVAHLREVDRRRVLDARQLAGAWTEVHRCDAEVLDALEPSTRDDYQRIVDTPHQRPSRQARAWSTRSAVRAGEAGLHVAIHRRLVVLQPVCLDLVDLVPQRHEPQH